MRLAPLPAAALLVIVLGAACGRCGRPAGAPPERFLPADAAAAFVVPRLDVAQEELAPLVRTALAIPALAGLSEALASVAAQLGFDPLDPEGPSQAGLDPARGAGLALDASGAALLALPVSDVGKLEGLVARLARDRLGAGRAEAVAVAGRPVTVFRMREGAPSRLALAFAEGTALLAPGPEGPARAAAAAARPAAEALGASPLFGRARAALGEGHAAFSFAPPGSPWLARLPAARDGAALGLSGTATRLALRAALLLPPQRAEAWRAVLGPGTPVGAGGEALGHLPRDAFLAARFDGDPAALARRLSWAIPGAAAALEGAGLDPERDLAPLLEPGCAAALALAPTFDVAAVSRGAADLPGRDAFRMAHLVAVLTVKDAERARAALDALARAQARPAPRAGERQAPAATAPGRPWRFTVAGAELAASLDGRRLYLAGGAGRLEALLAGVGQGYAPPSAAARQALSGGAAGLVLDLGQLVASFRALPPEAYGTGPDAFVMRSLAERLVDPASRLVAASLRVNLAEGAARLDLTLDARPPEGHP